MWLVNRTEIKFLYLDRNIHITVSILFKDVSYLSKYTYLCISSIWFSQTGTGTVQMGDGIDNLESIRQYISIIKQTPMQEPKSSSIKKEIRNNLLLFTLILLIFRNKRYLC